MLLVSNRESIRRNNRWKRKEKKKRGGGREIGRFHEGAKRFEEVGRGSIEVSR